jgi:hypothetical protein
MIKRLENNSLFFRGIKKKKRAMLGKFPTFHPQFGFYCTIFAA